MSLWFLIQIAVNIIFLVGFAIIWLRLKRPPKDDPRLSRGLQLLQSKITVLEDLSNRTDKQFDQLTSLLDQKSRMLQSKIFESENQIQKIKNSMSKSLEVAEIFQDKIPHDEIIERKNTTKYVVAARMAHAGKSVEEIMREVDLPKEQLDMISKVNRDQLVFSEESLPAWAQTEEPEEVPAQTPEQSQKSQFDHVMNESLNPASFQIPETEFKSLKKLGEEFRDACDSFEEQQKAHEEMLNLEESKIVQAAKRATEKVVQGVENFVSEPFISEQDSASVKTSDQSSESQAPETPQIQRVVFPRVDLGE